MNRISLEQELPFELILSKCDLLPTRQQSVNLAKKEGLDTNIFQTKLFRILAPISSGRCSYQSNFSNRRRYGWTLYYALKRNLIETSYISQGGDSLKGGSIYMITMDGAIALYRLRRGENVFENPEF